MNIMFLKHSKPLSNSQKASITKNFMLVFSDEKELQEINDERIAQHMEELVQKKLERKQEIYRKMADRQIEEVLAQIMSMSDYDEKKFERISSEIDAAVSTRTVSVGSQVSDSADIFNDS